MYIYSIGNAVNTLIQKHIYVHVPPQEAENHQSHAVAPVVQNQKHYKIIFIKAPSAPTYSQAQLAAATNSHSEEKTIVYVLSKKPQDLSEIVQTAAQAPIVPSKPEVFFIKYKTQEGQLDGGASAVGSADSFSSTHSHAHSQSGNSGVIGQPAPVYGPAH